MGMARHIELHLLAWKSPAIATGRECTDTRSPRTRQDAADTCCSQSSSVLVFIDWELSAWTNLPTTNRIMERRAQSQSKVFIAAMRARRRGADPTRMIGFL